MPRTPGEMFATMLARLPERTGRSLEEWLPLVQAQPLPRRKERIAWLQQEHGVSHGYAMVIAEKSLEATSPVALATADELLDGQYAGGKAGLRLVYDRLSVAARALGSDVLLEPRKSYVSVSRSQQFAVIQATNRSRVDLGLRLKGVATTARLLEAPGFGSGSITHRVALATPEQIDGQVLGWLRAAYVLVR